MNIGLLTFYLSNYQELANLIVPERRKYCEKHDYENLVVVGPYKEKDWYYAYDRLVFVRDYLDSNKNMEFIFVLNIQSVITNFTKKITDFTDDTYDCWVTKDVGGINCGSMIFRNSDWTKKWLDFIISKEPEYRNDCWHEQRCFQHNWMEPKWAHKINLLPQNSINSYLYTWFPPWNEKTSGHWKSGDFILSMPGTDLKRRLEVVRSEEMKNRIIYE